MKLNKNLSLEKAYEAIKKEMEKAWDVYVIASNNEDIAWEKAYEAQKIRNKKGEKVNKLCNKLAEIENLLKE